jgi:hypothetical protein
MIEWIYFVPGLALLVFPAEALLSAKVELRSFEAFKTLEDSPRFRRWWWVPALWLDPMRAWAGAWLIRRAIEPFLADDNAATSLAYWIAVVVLALAVAAQTVARQRREGSLAPIGFLAGLALALTPPAVASIAVVAAVAAVFAFRQFSAFFVVGAAMLLVLGLLLAAPVEWVVPVVILFAVPIAVALVSGRPLELPTRNSSGATT